MQVLPCARCDHRCHCSLKTALHQTVLLTVGQILTLLPVTPPATEDGSHHDSLRQSFVPIAAPSMTEQEAVQQCVLQCRPSSRFPSALMWPSIRGMPLNEFTTEGNFTCAFPTLFPMHSSWLLLGPTSGPSNYRQLLQIHDAV